MKKSKPILKIEIPESETEIETAILEFLNLSGWYARKIPLAGYFDPKTRRYRKHKSPYIAIGFSDIWAIKNSMTKYFEVKSKTGVQSADQKEFERNLKIHGHDYYLVRSVAEVQAIIQVAERDNKHKALIDLKQYEDCYGQA